ncbi:hypothetical protein F383_27515 [Gossypium arboreum]|uniref:Uncharacterized protein n=1 Tax=Gossypium arboreum TaxID=29729 RepID=A0A0B0PF89_GOSAR|nr:hypothetical protein F383_27515 [Gossypium arboreum]
MTQTWTDTRIQPTHRDSIQCFIGRSRNTPYR